MRWVVSGLFFLSGMAGLMLELLWMRQLSLVLGSTIEAAALVTGTFLAFLGLGAALGERWSRRGSPLVAYALVEFGVAVTGIAVSTLLPHSGWWVASLSAHLPSPWFVGLLRLLVCSLSLGLPCLLMGASLPLLCAHLSRLWGPAFARGLGQLYALNTLGGAVGVLVCDGALIPHLGLGKTAWVAATVDILVAVTALQLGRQPQPVEAEVTSDPSPPSRPAFPRARLLGVAWGLGLSGTLLQLVWTRCLMVFQGSDHWAYSGCLASYLVCLASGGAVVSLLPTRLQAGRRLPELLLLASVFSALSLWLLPWAQRLPALMANPLLIAPTGILLGLAFPLLAEQCHLHIRQAAASAGWVLAANTAGSLSGSLLAAFLALPWGGLQGTLVAGSLWLGLLGWLLAPALARALVPLGLLVAFTVLLPRDYVFRLFLPVDPSRIVYRGEDSYGALALVAQPQAVGEPSLELIVDGFNMMSSGLPTRRYATALAALPALWQPEAADILVICLGLGHTTEAALRLPHTRRVDCVELSPHVPRALARTARGQKLLNDPKLHVHIGDGRHYLLTSERQFDVITAEPPPPVRAGAVHLYTRDYYRLCASRLKPGGLVAQWFPIFQIPRQHTRAMIAAFLEVFPHAYLIEGAGPQLLMVGATRPWQVDFSGLVERVARAAPGLQSTGWDSAELQLGSVLMGPEQLSRYVAGCPVLSDDWPILEYQRLQWDPDYAGLMFNQQNPALPLGRSGPQELQKLQQAASHLRGLRRYLCETMVADSDRPRLPPSGLLERCLWVRAFLREYPQNLYLLAACEATPELLQERLRRPQYRPLAAKALFFLGQNPAARAAFEGLGPEAPLELQLLRWLVNWELGLRQDLLQQGQPWIQQISPEDRQFVERLQRVQGASSKASMR